MNEDEFIKCAGCGQPVHWLDAILSGGDDDWFCGPCLHGDDGAEEADTDGRDGLEFADDDGDRFIVSTPGVW